MNGRDGLVVMDDIVWNEKYEEEECCVNSILCRHEISEILPPTDFLGRYFRLPGILV